MNNKEEIIVDLHLHSTASDGQYAPSELVLMANSAKIRLLALTDHDSVSGIKEARERAKEIGLPFISGIEISTKGYQELHILGYNIDECNESLLAMCKLFEKDRLERASKIYNYLNNRGISLIPGSVELIASSDNIGRPHFAQAMLQQGFISNIREAFDKHLAFDDFNTIEREKCSSLFGINLIKQAGGIAALAHPGKIKLSMDKIEELIVKLVSEGLEGLECYYTAHTKEQTAAFIKIAHKYNLIITGGSDFHGEKVKPDIMLGNIKLTRELISKITRQKIEE